MEVGKLKERNAKTETLFIRGATRALADAAKRVSRRSQIKLRHRIIFFPS